MDAVSVAIAKSVEGIISRSSLSQSDFTLERSYAEWDLDLAKLDALEIGESEKLRVDVVSHTTEQQQELSSRTSVKFEIPIDIAVRQKFGESHRDSTTGRVVVEQVDALILFLQELHLLLTRVRVEDEVNAVWIETQTIAAPVREHLREMRQFTGIIRIVFRADVCLLSE